MKRPLLPTLGVFLLVGAVYVAAGPGRIDSIDGQYRFEVAKNIIEDRSIQLMDPFLTFGVQGINGVYSPYSISGSVVALPLVALGKVGNTPSVDRQQFLFSFTSAVLGAAGAAVLLLFYLTLGVTRRSAVAWTLVASFATLAFPAATSVLDQIQQSFFALCACFFAFLSGRRDSMGLAVLSGAALAVLVNFQEIYVILFPTLAIAALAPPGAAAAERRRSIERAVVIMFVGGLGLLMWGAINKYRFDSLLFSGKQSPMHPPALGNPLIGLPGLLVSPGKSILLYNPLTVVALFGVSRLFNRERRLAQAVSLTSLAYLGLISCLTFYGGDWCWGPRYLVSILPLLALGLPFVGAVRRPARIAIRGLVAAGVCVQLLGISVDHHRFFYERSLPTYFWYVDRSFYFHHSALLERPGELLETIVRGVPPEAERFRPGPHQELVTYAVFGGWGHPELTAPLWMRRYRVFWLPRPWPLWMGTIPQQKRPIDLRTACAILLATGLAGAATVGLGLWRAPAEGSDVRT